MNFSTTQWVSIAGVGILMIGLGILFALAQQRRTIQDRVDPGVSAEDPVLYCDPGEDPYDSDTIVVTNNTDQVIENLRSDVFRCAYEPGILEQYRGSFVCEPTCDPGEDNCRVGVWDESSTVQSFSLEPGESRTFSAPANPCEIVQIDVQNPAADNGAGECHNVKSQYTVQPGEIFPGGIAFGLSENPAGYDPATGSCPEPTASPTATPTIRINPPTATPTTALINTPVPPKGGVPTAVPVAPTATPTIPISGSGSTTIVGVVGAVGLLLLAAVALRL